MASYTLRPNANWNGDTLFTGTGGSDHAVLADDSDATFLLRTSTTVPASYEAEFGTIGAQSGRGGRCRSG
jgi:hypothetical protein